MIGLRTPPHFKSKKTLIGTVGGTQFSHKTKILKFVKKIKKPTIKGDLF